MLSVILFFAPAVLPGPIVAVSIAGRRGRPRWLVTLCLVAVCQIIALWLYRQYGSWSVACIGESCTEAMLRLYEMENLGFLFVVGMAIGAGLTAAMRAWWAHRSGPGATPA
jgi:hypothetical protein